MCDIRRIENLQRGPSEASQPTKPVKRTTNTHNHPRVYAVPIKYFLSFLFHALRASDNHRRNPDQNFGKYLALWLACATRSLPWTSKYSEPRNSADVQAWSWCTSPRSPMISSPAAALEEKDTRQP